MGHWKVVNGDGCLTTAVVAYRQNSACAHNRGKNCDGVKWIIFGTVPVGFWSSHLSVLYPPQVIFSDAPSSNKYDNRLIFYLFPLEKYALICLPCFGTTIICLKFKLRKGRASTPLTIYFFIIRLRDGYGGMRTFPFWSLDFNLDHVYLQCSFYSC